MAMERMKEEGKELEQFGGVQQTLMSEFPVISCWPLHPHNILSPSTEAQKNPVRHGFYEASGD